MFPINIFQIYWELLTTLSYISSRTLENFAGKIISTKFVLGLSWEKKFYINSSNKMAAEMLFWKFNIRKLDNINLCTNMKFRIYSFILTQVPEVLHGESLNQ